MGWARTPGHDTFYLFNAKRFLALLPPPGRLTLDIGAGEGRLARELVALGHRVVALDSSATLAAACADGPSGLPAAVSDAEAVPFTAGCADLAIAFMSPQDFDHLDAVIGEVAGLLAPGGCFCMAIVHPINSAGRFEGDPEDLQAPFVLRGSYVSSERYRDDVERNGVAMTFHSVHRPLESYSRALEHAGFVIEAIREVAHEDPGHQWSRIPCFLHIRARVT